MYVEMDRKPENLAEIQNAAYVRSGIMMRLRIVNSAKNEEDQLPHGTKVLKELVMTWANTDRIILRILILCIGACF